jgi:hypothetical protein
MSIQNNVNPRSKKTRRPAPERPWHNKDGTLFGWIDGYRPRIKLELSHHSMLSLARENNRRLSEDLLSRLEYAMSKQ